MNFFNESLCFFGYRPIEHGFCNESVCLTSGIFDDGAVPFFHMSV